MESFDYLGLIQGIYDFVEDRLGKVAAWLITTGVVAALAIALVLTLRHYGVKLLG
jgi:hypothetical protein